MGKNLISLIYFALVVACVAISVYLSYFGYLTSFEALALPFTIVLGIGLFGADALIQRARVAGKSLLAPFLLFLLFAIFSAASNFNYLYTNFMERDVLRSTLDSQFAIFRDNLTVARDRLEREQAYTFTEEKRVELDRELARLRDQALDVLRPGCGERCRGHIATVERILGKSLTDIAVPAPGADQAAVASWFERFEASAREDFAKLVETNGFPAIAGAIADINALLLEFDTPNRSLARNAGLSVLRELSEASEEIERRTNAILGDAPPVAFKTIDSTLGRLGEIVYSFENAFGQMPNPLATVVSAVLSIVIDIFPVVFALVAFSPDPGRVHRPGGRRGRAGTVLE